MMPQYWSLQDPDIACGPLVDAAASLSSMGITSGLMVPVHGMYGNRHLMNFAGDRDILPQAALNEPGHDRAACSGGL